MWILVIINKLTNIARFSENICYFEIQIKLFIEIPIKIYILNHIKYQNSVPLNKCQTWISIDLTSSHTISIILQKTNSFPHLPSLITHPKSRLLLNNIIAKANSTVQIPILLSILLSQTLPKSFSNQFIKSLLQISMAKTLMKITNIMKLAKNRTKRLQQDKKITLTIK